MAARQLADRADLQRELESLWEFHLGRLRAGVPVRHLFDRVVFSQDPPLRLARCDECSTVYRNPREDPRVLTETYAGEEPGEDTMERLYHVQRMACDAQARRLAAIAGPHGTGLEVGSYIGAFLAAAGDRGWSFEGVDVNSQAADFARRRGFRVHESTIEELPGDRAFDAVVFWNCFDQLPDPRAAARAARRRLRTGGILAVRVPNGGFYSRWRSRLTGVAAPIARRLLSHNNLLGFPYRHGFTPESLGRLLGECGFEPLHVLGDTLVPVADRWTRPWAAIEERAVKAALGAVSGNPRRMPWFEIYARAA